MIAAGLAVALVGLPAASAFADAPRQLDNKTIQISWSVSTVRVESDGQRKSIPVAASHTIYISAAGRLFHRGSRSAKAGRKQSDNAPGSTRNAGGEASAVRFSGNKLIGSTAFAQGARQFVATFDPGFSSCTVTVAFGREGGGMKRRGIDGKMATIESMTASGESCSIRDGNPFGD